MPRLWLIACGLLLLAGATQAAQQALLVGVSEYPALPERRLPGAANDVRLMVKSLSAIGWRPTQLQVLAEQGDALPTRANILQALERIALSSRSGDWVLLYFSGHGAQVPTQSGLDEAFLPRDTTHWDDKRGELRGALRDKELASAVQRIRAQGAHVWAVLDTCHAADMLRGPAAGPLSGLRFITAPELRIPVHLWGPGRRLSASALRQTKRQGGAATGRYVAFFAAGKDEASLEERLPDPLDGRQDQRYGVFTWALARALREAPTADFASLARRVGAAYAERPFPTPEFVGNLETAWPW